MAVIAVAGFHHETNTFAPSKAAYADFESGGSWPALTRGSRAADVVDGMNIALAGFAAAARTAGHRLVPLVWANATPSAHVTRDAYEQIVTALLEELGRAEAIDALYLDLHGAMVAEHLDDGEGELLRRIRALVGARVPIMVTLDYHANVTQTMVAHATAMIGYRSYPHVDMAETGRRAAALLDRILSEGDAPAKAFRQLDFLIPITAQCTMIEPSVALFQRLAALEIETASTLSFAGGFPAADIPDCGPSVFGYGFDAARVAAAVDGMANAVRDAEAEFAPEFLAPDDAVRRAMAQAEPDGPPVVLADTQDNPGAGANGDTVGVLEALLRHRAQNAVLGLLIDPPSAKQAHEAGKGAEREFSLGAISGLAGHRPCVGPFKVERLGDGNFLGTGPFYAGSKMSLGPMAALRRNGVTVVLASKKVQAADQAMFRCLGIDPAKQSILALKSSVHFRADFQPIAKEILVVASPGPNPADPATLPWTKLRRGVRLRPKGPSFGDKAVGRGISIAVIAVAVLVGAAGASAQPVDRYEGYYYPKAGSHETYVSRAKTLEDSDRGRRLGFVSGLTQQMADQAYAPTYAIFAKGESADRLIIVAYGEGQLNTIYRARALFASLTSMARLTPLFQQLQVEEIFTFFDLCKLIGFNSITVSDGDKFAHRIVLR